MMPLEIYTSIFSFIPEKEQENLPLVCKTWHELLSHKVMTRQKIKLYAHKTLNSKSTKFEEQQIDSIVSLLLNSSIIVPLKQIPLCRLKYGTYILDIDRYLVHKKTNTRIFTKSSYFEGASRYFDVIWNSRNLKFEINTQGKRGDFSSEFCLVTEYNQYCMNPLFNFTLKRLSFARPMSGFYKQAGWFKWYSVSEEQLVPKDMPELIKDTLNVKPQAYIERLTRLNLTVLARFSNLQDFENLKCLCDERGVITQSKDTPFSFSLKLNVFQSRQDKTVELLDWIADDFSDDRNGSLKDVLRWTVISATADEVAKKFGIQLELEKEK